MKVQMNNRIVNDILSDSKLRKTLIGFYESGNDDNFQVGYVLDFNEESILYQHLNKFGVKDGIHTIMISNLEKIEKDTYYIRGIQLLLENNDLISKQNTNKAKLSPSENWQYDFLNENSLIGELITFQLGGSEFYNFGFLIDFDLENIMVSLISESGENQGKSVYHLIDIVAFGIDSLQCRKRKHLYFSNNKANN